ncbi:MAG: FCD domain-containing protein [Gemmatimonadales bacterium]|nr:MAG: FCD domain-containing protein [Gemmatimonadales bacterium]
MAFHSLIAAASRNEVLSLLYQTIAAQGQQSRRFEYIRKQVGAPYLNSNRNILNALKKRDVALAEKLIKRHLDTLIRDVKKYWHTFLD